jgi:hypothetical protein
MLPSYPVFLKDIITLNTSKDFRRDISKSYFENGFMHSLEEHHILQCALDYQSYDEVSEDGYIAATWISGGATGGGYMDDCFAQAYDTGDTDAPILLLDYLLEKYLPDMTDTQRQEFKNSLPLQTGSLSDYEYYGNYTDYGYIAVSLSKVYTALKEYVCTP